MNNATACFYLSGLHISGVTTIPSPAEAEAQPKLSTSTKSTNKSTLSEKVAQQEFIIQKDMKKAFGFAYKACELKNAYACANLSQMYARGEGTEKNEANADKYRKIAIDIQDEVKKQNTTLGFQQGIL